MKKFKERIGRDDSDIKEKRTKYSKTFKEDKKTYTTYVSNSEVHYFSPEGYGTHPEKDEWRDVDTNLSITQSLNPDKYINHYLVSTNSITYGFRNDNKIEKFMGIREKYNDNMQIEISPIKIKYDDKEYNLKNKTFNKIEVVENNIKHYINNNLYVNTDLVYNKVTNAYVINELLDWFEIELDVEFNGCEILNDYYISNNTKIFVPKNGIYYFKPTSSIYNKTYTINNPYMWNELGNKSYDVDGVLSYINGKYKYIKIPNKEGVEWLYRNSNPIYIDLTVNVSGTNMNVAGCVGANDAANWSVAHDGDGNYIDTVGLLYVGVSVNKDDTIDIYRSFFSFSSSKIPSNATVTVADFKYSCISILVSDPCVDVRASSWTPSLALSDYSGNYQWTGDGHQNSCLTVSLGLNTINLNSSGVAYINDHFSQGYLRYVMRDHTYDVLDTEPAGQGNWIMDVGGDDYIFPPYLAVTYTLPAGVTYTSFKTPQYSGSAHHVALGWTWNSGCFNSASGMCSFTGDGTSWKWYVISSSSTHFYPSGDATSWKWVSGNCGI